MNARLRRTLLLGATLAAIVVGAAVLAAPVTRLLEGWGVEARGVAGADDLFLKTLRRLLLIPLAVLFLVALQPWREPGGLLVPYGLAGPRARPGLGLGCAGVTLLVCALLLGAHLASGWLRFEDPIDSGRLAARAGKVLLTAVVVGVLEEWFFRGWLPRRLGRTFRPGTATVLAAAGFALLHAFQPSALEVEVEPSAAGAFHALATWAARAVDPRLFVPALTGLFLFALVLSAAYARTGTLWAPIGIHAAGAWVVFTHGAATDRIPERTWAGSKALHDGPPTWLLLLAAYLLLRRRTGRPAPTASDAPP
jgi:membrane protease YdiL (CAAX protease family)